ncbi:NAD(P)-dependent oxidoreductase [Streptomyces sp. NPDC000618]|uniref:NAD(P)-dependent oxidoreductase n=1 Tax=Streptomyces sp. NPDC000618 TaxID=3154265 RepID=UPI00332CFFF6
MSDPLRVGFIGLGSQGAPMARRIVGAGFETTLWARRPAALEPFADTPARSAGSIAELAAASDLVCLCVVDDVDVEQVGAEVLSGLRPGGIVAVHSTVHPDTCRRLAGRARAQGVQVLDAPVSGGGRAAAQGALLVLVGGDGAVLDTCRPVFETYGDPVVHLGPTGSGQLAKLLNNLLFTAQLGLAADVLEIGGRLGLDREGLGRFLPQGSSASFAMERVVDAGGTLDRISAHAGKLLAKDVRLFEGLATEAAEGAVEGAVEGAGQGPTREAARAALRAMGL